MSVGHGCFRENKRRRCPERPVVCMSLNTVRLHTDSLTRPNGSNDATFNISMSLERHKVSESESIFVCRCRFGLSCLVVLCILLIPAPPKRYAVVLAAARPDEFRDFIKFASRSLSFLQTNRFKGGGFIKQETVSLLSKPSSFFRTST